MSKQLNITVFSSGAQCASKGLHFTKRCQGDTLAMFLQRYNVSLFWSVSHWSWNENISACLKLFLKFLMSGWCCVPGPTIHTTGWGWPRWSAEEPDAVTEARWAERVRHAGLLHLKKKIRGIQEVWLLTEEQGAAVEHWQVWGDGPGWGS